MLTRNHLSLDSVRTQTDRGIGVALALEAFVSYSVYEALNGPNTYFIHWSMIDETFCFACRAALCDLEQPSHLLSHGLRTNVAI